MSKILTFFFAFFKKPDILADFSLKLSLARKMIKGLSQF